jgi:hypothetical protein
VEADRTGVAPECEEICTSFVDESKLTQGEENEPTPANGVLEECKYLFGCSGNKDGMQPPAEPVDTLEWCEEQCVEMCNARGEGAECANDCKKNLCAAITECACPTDESECVTFDECQNAGGSMSANCSPTLVCTPTGTTDEGTTDEGTTDEGTTDEGTTDEGTTDEGTTDEGTTDGTVGPKCACPYDGESLCDEYLECLAGGGQPEPADCASESFCKTQVKCSCPTDASQCDDFETCLQDGGQPDPLDCDLQAVCPKCKSERKQYTFEVGVISTEHHVGPFSHILDNWALCDYVEACDHWGTSNDNMCNDYRQHGVRYTFNFDGWCDLDEETTSCKPDMTWGHTANGSPEYKIETKWDGANTHHNSFGTGLSCAFTDGGNVVGYCEKEATGNCKVGSGAQTAHQQGVGAGKGDQRIEFAGAVGYAAGHWTVFNISYGVSVEVSKGVQLGATVSPNDEDAYYGGAMLKCELSCDADGGPMVSGCIATGLEGNESIVVTKVPPQ